MKFGILGLVAFMGLAPSVGLAEGFGEPEDLPTSAVTDIRGIFDLIVQILNFAFTLLLILAVVFIIVAAYKYLTAGGDVEKLKSAHSTLIWALVAVVVAVFAIALVNIVKNAATGGLVE